MFSTFCKLLFVYIVLTFLFSDLSQIKDPGKDFFVKQYEDVSRVAKKFANYVDDTVIPKVDTFFEEKGDENLVGTIVDGLMKDEEFKVDIDIPSLQIEKEPFTEGSDIQEDTFFEDKEWLF